MNKCRSPRCRVMIIRASCLHPSSPRREYETVNSVLVNMEIFVRTCLVFDSYSRHFPLRRLLTIKERGIFFHSQDWCTCDSRCSSLLPGAMDLPETHALCGEIKPGAFSFSRSFSPFPSLWFSFLQQVRINTPSRKQMISI